jgi:tRNA U34 5-methylaminomethyl-2-thiouridine-forming methyltransferase MnmC
MPPDAPAATPFGSITRTFAPRRAQAHATDKPKAPAPRTVTSVVVIAAARLHCSTDHIRHETMTDQRAELEWRDSGVPVSVRFDDPYYSLEDGLAETRHVFLEGNDLPARFMDGFHVAELGFGTGLNFLVTLAAWREAGIAGTLHFTSFEAYPMRVEEMLEALKVFEGLPVEVFEVDRERLPNVIRGEDFELRVIHGDARETLAEWDGNVDAWFLDGFSPAKNPELWGADLMAEVGRHTATAGTFATYTAAGFVRRGLQDAGFAVERAPGFGRKRHMTRGVRS